MVAGVCVGAGLGFVYLVFILFSGSSGSRGRKGKDEVGKDRDAAQGNGRID